VTHGTWIDVLLPDGVDRTALGALASLAREMAPPADWRSPTGRLDARRALQVAAEARGHDGPVLLVTTIDLRLADCRSLFALSDPSLQAAVVSTARLDDPAAPEALPRRTSNVAAHELGHLLGRRHCRNPECLMHPAKTLADVDARSARPCHRCSGGSGLRRVVRHVARRISGGQR